MIPLLACIAILTTQTADQPLYRFIAYGDSRGSDPSDTDMSIQKTIIRDALMSKPAFIIQTGDLVYDSSMPALWDQFDSVMQPVWDALIPYYPAEGNHDNVGASHYADYLQKRIMKTWEPVRPSGALPRYSVDKSPLRLIAIDTEESSASDSKQYRWIESELVDARAHGLVPVPFFHITLHSIGAHGSNPKKQAELEPLFVKYHVPLVFMGHDHIYYRTRRHGIVYVTTGGAGAPLYDLEAGKDPRDEATDPTDPNWPDVSQKTYHYCICDVFKDRVDITVQAVHFDGPNPIDVFSVPLK